MGLSFDDLWVANLDAIRGSCDSDDVFQDLYIRCKKIYTEEKESYFVYWAKRCAWYSNNRRKPRKTQQYVESTAKNNCLVDMKMSIPEDVRSFVDMRAEGYNLQEIAEKTGKSLSHVKKRSVEVKEILRACLCDNTL